MLVRNLLALAATATAANIRVDVGKSGLTFTPDSVTAAKGDVVEFYFVGGNHDAVALDYSKPCEPLASTSPEAFASATVAGAATNTKVFRVNVTSTDPIYYYCSVGMHCANGMVAAINPAADKTVAALKTAAKGKTAKRPASVYGGTMG